MITITTSNCINCHHCAKACPSRIFAVSSEKSIEIKNADRCIGCGHCVAVCASNAIVHSDFPTEKVHAIDYSKLPTPEQTLLLIRKRRSNRVFSSKAIPDEWLSQILDAAHRAPTASNLQLVEFTLITDPDKLNALTEFTLDAFTSSLKFVDNAVLRPICKRLFPYLFRYLPVIKKMKQVYLEQGKDIGILRGATAVLFIHTPTSARWGCEDSNLAYQNASLMAESLGVAQFYTGFVLRAAKLRRKKLEKTLGINGTIHAGMALGMPMFEYPNYIDRKAIKVKKM